MLNIQTATVIRGEESKLGITAPTAWILSTSGKRSGDDLSDSDGFGTELD